MIELHVQQGTREWLNARAKCFNASEAPAMMGVSRYVSRSELIRQKATGIVPEPDAATLGRFNAGHEAEAKARPLVEKIIGEELYPIVATDDDGRLLASSDGATMLCNIGFEHKLWNAEVAANVKDGNVPDSHKWQLDQQIAVFGFEKIMFVCSDGTPDNFVWCWYETTPERIAQLRAGWDQFEKDMANYQPTESKPAAVAEVIEDLPALTVQLVGQVTASNLDAFQSAVTARIQAINTNLVTDSDFATADKMVKFLDDGEKRLELVKSQALAQTASIDQLFRTIDSLKAEMKSKRLTLDKLVKAEKENRKGEIVTKARADLVEHVQALHKRTGVTCIQIDGGIFAEAIKGLKSLDSMRDKVSVALANAKVEANAIADRIDANRKTVEDMSLVPDFSQVCMKPADDFAALLSMRVAQRKEAEEKRLEAERQRIRAEEQAKAQREADAKAAAERAEAKRVSDAEQAERDRIAAEEIRKLDAERKAIAEAQQRMLDEAEDRAIVAEPNQRPEASSAVQGTAVTPLAGNQEAATQAFSGKTMNLGQINAELGFTVSSDFLASLGMLPVRQEKAAKLYDARKLPTICRLIQEHLAEVMVRSFREAA